nr:amino acid racemase [Eubacterium sp.]
MKTIGIIGGLGPMATVQYLEMVTKMTDVTRDQEHPRLLLTSIPDTPDRTEFILGKSNESPLPHMVRAGRQLAEMGADFVTIPCVTAQYFYEELVDALPVPVISLCGNVAEDVAAKGIRKVGLLATSGTIESKVLEQEFAKAGVEAMVPEAAEQELVMTVIYDQIKKGTSVNWNMVNQVRDSLLDRGAEKLILGCTELSLLKKEKELGSQYVDVLEVLAQKTVLASGAALLKEYVEIVR